MEEAFRQFRTRAACFSGILLLLFGVILYRVCDLGGFHRDRYLSHCLQAISHEGTFTPIRGKICDKNGIKLAWSERFFDLYLANDLPQNITMEEALQLAEESVHGTLLRPIQTEFGILLKQKIPVKEVASLQNFLRRYPFFQVKQRIERLQISDPRARSILGTVRDGHGVSGLEKKYDALLAGTPGQYTVLLDRNHRKIPQTLKLKKAPVSGTDLFLDVNLQELTEILYAP